MVGMYLGICRADIAAANAPLGPHLGSNAGSTGHGYYLFGNGGYVYSHTDATVNDKVLAFKYSTSENMEVSYDPARGRVRAKKGSEEYELTVPEAADYRICALMYYTGEAVTVEMKEA